MMAVVVVALVFTAWMAVVAIVKGRVPSGVGRRGVHPRMWGYGTLLFCAGVALFQFGSSVRGNTAGDVVFGSGAAVFSTGCVLRYRSVRPADPVPVPAHGCSDAPEA
ncbi:hypothetical protein OK074_0976 [Actinobacteria bacterium OK074]|nr:hypothetical protein OK074_0976 [Actinobacteria bacterium OK074]